MPGYFARVHGYDITNTPLIPAQARTTGGRTVASARRPVANRKTATPAPSFASYSEAELEELVDLFDYGTPLWGGLLSTGDETPILPFALAGFGLLCLAALLLTGRKRRRAA